MNRIKVLTCSWALFRLLLENIIDFKLIVENSIHLLIILLFNNRVFVVDVQMLIERVLHSQRLLEQIFGFHLLKIVIILLRTILIGSLTNL